LARSALAETFDGRPLVVVRRIDGIGKRVNVADFVRKVDLDEGAGEALAAAGLVGTMESLIVEVDIRGSGSVKIAEVVEVLLGSADVAHRAVRTALGKRLPSGVFATPLDLLVLRATLARQAMPHVGVHPE
jgi:hypothetical protein